LALTASHTGEVYDKMTKVGMNDILSKPFKKDELLQKVRNMLKIDEDNNNSFTTITTTITTTISTTSPLTPRLPKKQ
jgi:DNA-binding response OmpR family regulator